MNSARVANRGLVSIKQHEEQLNSSETPLRVGGDRGEKNVIVAIRITEPIDSDHSPLLWAS